MARWIFAAIVLMTAVVGTSVGTEVAHAVYLGEDASTPTPWAAFVTKTWSLDAPTNFTGTCTGTFVTPRVVLTAAHCVVDTTFKFKKAPPVLGMLPAFPERFQTGVAEIAAGRVLVAADPSVESGAPTGVEYQAARLIVHPSYLTGGWQNADHDLALVVLAQPVPGVTPIALVPPAAHNQQAGFDLSSVTLTGYGYGLTEIPKGYAVSGSIDLLYGLDGPLQRTVQGSYTLSTDCPVSGWRLCFIRTSPQKSALMVGDSGGPSLAEPGAPVGAGNTTNALQIAVNVTSDSKTLGAAAVGATAMNLAYPPYSQWIADEADTVFGSKCPAYDCILDLGDGTPGWYVHNGFGHRIPDWPTRDCLVADGAGAPVLVDEFELAQVPRVDTTVECEQDTILAYIDGDRLYVDFDGWPDCSLTANGDINDIPHFGVEVFYWDGINSHLLDMNSGGVEACTATWNGREYINPRAITSHSFVVSAVVSHARSYGYQPGGEVYVRVSFFDINEVWYDDNGMVANLGIEPAISNHVVIP